MMSNISHIILHVDIPTMLSDAIFSDRLFVLITGVFSLFQNVPS